MSNSFIEGIGRVEIGVTDFDLSTKFLCDFGLNQKTENTFSTLNKSEIVLYKQQSLCIKSITWCINDIPIEKFYQDKKDIIDFENKIENNRSVECIDPSGIRLIFTENFKTQDIDSGLSVNSWNNITRIDTPIPKHNRIEPIEIAHIVIETADIESCENFYKSLGFVVSDRLVNRGVFLRCNDHAGHHDLFLINSNALKINHMAFTVGDIYQLFQAGKILESKNWKTAYGPGRHNISSAFFWYFESPLEFMLEYTSNEDYLTDKWVSRDIVGEKDLLSKESFISR